MAPFQVFLPGDDGSARARALCCPAACRACGPAARATPLSLPPPALYRHPQGKQSAKERQTHIERERESDECASSYMLMHMHVKAPHISLASHTRTYSLIHSLTHSVSLAGLSCRSGGAGGPAGHVPRAAGRNHHQLPRHRSHPRTYTLCAYVRERLPLSLSVSLSLCVRVYSVCRG
jgi:hypothetical protein